MAVTVVFAGVPVTDYQAVLPWYERLLGRAPDMLPNENEAAWQLTDTGWIYLVGDADRAGTALLTILVDDLEAYVAELTERGLEIGEIETVPHAVRKAEITDPEGNRITFGQPLG